ncbi:hypothetical protein GCM10025868_16720 [Angustibacter aerolatus]|uniref:Uncharacterized protein n=1 Tax=Angustibacter aerolatus TaxID=1162965 RepID=A0ABQ6JF51_9ACTN|nr:hypothetical protein GCM10025868_16720 [Angustibacter aerolatus]
MSGAAQRLRADGVERAGLVQVGFDVLPAAALHGVVVVDAPHRAVALRPPDERVAGDGREAGVEAVVAHLLHGGVEVGGVEERAGALHEHRHLGVDPVVAQRVERVEDRALRRRRVARQVRRAPYDLGPGGTRDRGDVVGVGADDDQVDLRAGHGGVDRALDQPPRPDAGQVLARHAARPAACRHDGHHANGSGLRGCAHPTTVTTTSVPTVNST